MRLNWYWKPLYTLNRVTYLICDLTGTGNPYIHYTGLILNMRLNWSWKPLYTLYRVTHLICDLTDTGDSYIHYTGLILEIEIEIENFVEHHQF